MTTKLQAAQAEIRAVFTNEIETIYETEAHKLDRSRIVIWARHIRLQLNDGRTCESTINYAIHPDGYWEQIGLAVNHDYREPEPAEVQYQVKVWDTGYLADLPYDHSFTWGNLAQAEACYDAQVASGERQAVELIERRDTGERKCLKTWAR